MKTSILLTFFMFVLSALPAHAQRQYRGHDLREQSNVPLYDCAIFYSRADQADCRELTKKRSYAWEDGGYAVSCREVRSSKKDICLDLANSITYNPNAFDCNNVRGNRQDFRDCLVTKRAYARGEYNESLDYEYDRYFERDYDTSVTTTVTPITTTTAVTTCGPAYYDSSYEEWRQATRKQRRRSNTRRLIGGIGILAGAILRTSNDGTARAIGAGLMVGGAVMTTLGLIDLAETRIDMPHLRRDCSTNYIRETKYVVVDQKRCTSTRYTERGYGSSRSYYEVNCQNSRYVTYKRFDAYESSNEYVY